jgi:hypothetical protein
VKRSLASCRASALWRSFRLLKTIDFRNVKCSEGNEAEAAVLSALIKRGYDVAVPSVWDCPMT